MNIIEFFDQNWQLQKWQQGFSKRERTLLTGLSGTAKSLVMANAYENVAEKYIIVTDSPCTLPYGKWFDYPDLRRLRTLRNRGRRPCQAHFGTPLASERPQLSDCEGFDLQGFGAYASHPIGVDEP